LRFADRLIKSVGGFGDAGVDQPACSGLVEVEQIARRIGLSEPTLRKYYLRELEQGSDLAMAVLDEVIWQRAMAGSVSAARLMKEALTKGGAATPIARVRAKAAAPLGKKAEANLAAQTAHEDSEWANLLPN
jgi:hypothetical protein